jgi:hypothetical protein
MGWNRHCTQNERQKNSSYVSHLGNYNRTEQVNG